MSFDKFEGDRYCAGGRHRSATKFFFGNITSRGSKVLIGYCSICNRKTSRAVSDNTMKAEVLGDFFKNFGEKGLNVSEKMAENVLENPSRALVITANIATKAASRNPENVMNSLPELTTFYNTGKGLYLGKVVPNFFGLLI